MTGQQFEWEHVVYRLWDVDGALLYVGITNDIKRRFAQHSKKSGWWPQVAKCEVEFHPTRDAAADAEHEAIHNEFPLYNERLTRSVHPLPGTTAPTTKKQPAFARRAWTKAKRLTEIRPAMVYAPGVKVPLRQQVGQDEWDWIHGIGEYAGRMSEHQVSLSQND